MRVSWSLVTVAACLYHNYGCTRADGPCADIKIPHSPSTHANVNLMHEYLGHEVAVVLDTNSTTAMALGGSEEGMASVGALSSNGTPARTTDEILLGQIDIAVRDDDDSNEVMMKPFEKKCVVDGKSYSHAQVVSYDANSRCICVAGNVYCFWHGLPPSPTESSPDQAKSNNNNADSEESNSNQSTEPACHDSSSLPNDASDEDSPAPSQPTSEDDLTDIDKNIDREKSEEDVEQETDDNDSINEDDEQNLVSEENTEESIATSPRTNLPTTPITCLVLDRTYRVGEVLPHNTGNCIECSCGPEGHVVCAPRDCVSIVPHRDYREENFQIPITGDLRGIDENF